MSLTLWNKLRLNGQQSSCMQRMRGGFLQINMSPLLCKTPELLIYLHFQKMHKNSENAPKRPIISETESTTKPVSKFVDFYKKNFLLDLPCFTQDSPHVLKKLKKQKNGVIALSDHVVETFYTNTD